MNLPEYIKSIGVPAFSRRFGVTERATISYQMRQRKPRPELAEKIVAETPVTWEGIYASKKAS